MAYFFILPAFAIWLVVAAIGLVLIRANPSFSAARPYAWRVVLWSTCGFVVANVFLVVVVAGAANLLGPGATERTMARDALQLIVGLGAILGPILASVVGWLGGVVLGAVLTRSNSSSNSTLSAEGSV